MAIGTFGDGPGRRSRSARVRWAWLGLCGDPTGGSILTPARISLVILALSLAGSAMAMLDADGGFDDLEIPVRASLSARAIPAGEEAYLAVIYDVPPDAHIQINHFLYADPGDDQPFVVGPPLLPMPQEFEGEPVFMGRTTIFHRILIPADAEPGSTQLSLRVGYQGCLERPIFACFAPSEVVLELPVTVLPPGGRTEEDPATAALFQAMASAPPPMDADETALAEAYFADAQTGSADSGPDAGIAPQTGLAGRLQSALARGSILAFLLVFLGGVATSFTPCVYPMIPITISYIGGRSSSRLGGFFLSVFFVLGIALTYSVLGVLAASTGALFGGAMQSTAVLVVVGGVFFAMGASMLGAFDLAMPSGVQGRLQGGPRAGILGAIFMGMVTGLVASPCVGPVVIVLLTWVAQIGSIWYGFLLLFIFALGLGMLFLLIGTFAGALAALPQAGGWMDTVKHFFGVVLIAMGIYYIRPILGPDITMALTGAFLLMIGTFLGAFRPVAEDPPKPVLLRKGVGIILLLVGGLYLLVGVAGMEGVSFAPGVGPAGVAGTAHRQPAWVADDVAGMEQAQLQEKPAFIDFYADWCVACVELDEKTWVDPAVLQESERFVAIKLDLTERNEWSVSKQAEYGVRGLPTVIFFDSFGMEVERFYGFLGPEEVLAIMRRID